MMKGNKDILSSVLKTTQMGQIGIKSVLKNSLNQKMQLALNSQLDEYDQIEKQIYRLAANQNLVLKELNPSIKVMTDMMTRMRLSMGKTNSKVASMMITGSTKGVIKGYKNLHAYDKSDNSVVKLMEELIHCEEANIKQMQGYL